MRLLYSNLDQSDPTRIVLSLTAPKQVPNSKHAKLIAGFKKWISNLPMLYDNDCADLNPFTLAENFLSLLSASKGEGTRSFIIAEGLTRFPVASFHRFGDPNHIRAVHPTWFSKDGVPLDVQAEIISETYHLEIEVNDLIEHVSEFAPGKYRQPLEKEIARTMYDFQQYYGFKLTYSYAQFLLRAQDKNDLPF